MSRDSYSSPRQCDLKERSSQEQLFRIAQFVSEGHLPLLAEVADEDRRTVLVEIARLRRQRLVDFIAREIASDIRRSQKQ